MASRSRRSGVRLAGCLWIVASGAMAGTPQVRNVQADLAPDALHNDRFALRLRLDPTTGSAEAASARTMKLSARLQVKGDPPATCNVEALFRDGFEDS